MKIPLQVTFRNLPRSEGVEQMVRQRATRLDAFYDRIISCRVMVEVPHRHHQQGNPYHVRIDLTVPGAELVVERAAAQQSPPTGIPHRIRKSQELGGEHRSLQVAIRDAFEAARRQLQDHVRRRRNQVKKHQRSPQEISE